MTTTTATATTRPLYWHGVDAQESYPEGCPINWEMIEAMVEVERQTTNLDLIERVCKVRETLVGLAIANREAGNRQGCDFFASQAMAMLNFYF